MDADEMFRSLSRLRQQPDRQCGGVRAVDAIGGQIAFGLLDDFGFEFQILVYGLDDQIAAVQVRGVGGGRDEP